MITIHRALLATALLVSGALALRLHAPAAGAPHAVPAPLGDDGPRHVAPLIPVRAPLAAHRRPAVPVLTIVATDFAYDAPDTVTAGPVRVRLKGAGREPHIVEIVRLDAPHRTEDYLEYREAHERDPQWATHVGGPTVVFGSDSTEVLLDLAPGEYVLLCPITSRDDHRAHSAKGMVRTLRVLERTSGRPPAAPRSDVTIALDDYGFVVTPLPRPGRRVIRVENRAAQPHEVVLVRLEPGQRVTDVVRWATDFVGPMPGRVVGGTTGLSRGATALLDVALLPGDYAMLCFVPDVKDGRSHVAHGMIGEFTVR